MMQDCMTSNKIKENKYKILRMSLILGSDDDRAETLNNFEESAREIDAMNDEIYIKDLEDKFYDTLKLEEEEKKLAVLVDYIGGRVEQRISLLSDFANITGYDLSNLPPIKYYDKLDDYKDRLKYIREYLQNTEQIETLNKEIEEAEQNLNDAYLSKATSEECNSRNEEIILNKFKNVIKSIAELNDVTESNLDAKLEEIIALVAESKKSLDIFNKSFTTLSGSGISFEEEQEYKSYVDNAKEVYYQNKEQEYLLRMYQYLLVKETEFVPILEKRQQINSLLYERLDLRKDLNINQTDPLTPMYDILEKQYDEIDHQRNNIEKIELLNNSIETKKEQVNDLEQDNQKVEILSLLREFCIIDTYADIENISTEDTEDTTSLNSNSQIDFDNTAEIPEEIELPEISPSIEIEQDEEKEELIFPEISDTTSSDTTSSDITSSNTISSDTPSSEESEKVESEEPQKEEEPEENEVILIEDTINIDLDLIHAKANKVMKRVGEMLGIKTEETKIVSVTNEPPISQKELPKVEPENKVEIPNNPLPAENPLFSNQIEEVEKPKEPESKIEEETSFWFPSDTPDALNELPDLEPTTDNNFFTNNNVLPDLSFPDLKIDFGNNDSEEK